MNKYFITWLLVLLLISSFTEAQNNLQVFTLEADLTSLFSDLRKKDNDAIMLLILNEIKNEADTSVSGTMKSLKDKLQKHNLRLEDCFHNVKSDNTTIEDYLISEIDNALLENISVIKSRLDQFGISEALIRKTGSKRITVEISLAKDEEKIKSLIETRGYLSFHLVKDKDFVRSILDSIDFVLNKSSPGLVENQFTELINFGLASGLNQMPVNIKLKKAIEIMLSNVEVKKIVPESIEFAWSERLIKTLEEEEYLILYILDKKPVLTGEVITDASYSSNPDNNYPYTSITMNSEGATIWEKFTSENINKECAIVFDGKVFSTPRIMSKITGGNLIIEGISSLDEAMILPIILKSGSLSVPMKIIFKGEK